MNILAYWANHKIRSCEYDPRALIFLKFYFSHVILQASQCFAPLLTTENEKVLLKQISLQKSDSHFQNTLFDFIWGA